MRVFVGDHAAGIANGESDLDEELLCVVARSSG